MVTMTSVKDWVFSQVISKSIGSTRPLSASERFLSQESQNEELGNQDLTQTNANLTSRPVSTSDIQITQNPLTPRVENFSGPNLSTEEKNLDPLAKVEVLQIKFLRLLRRLGLSQDNLTVAKVLYRIHLATLIRAGESDLKRANLKSDRARVIAAEQEEIGLPELDFSLKILILGKTGVGKSSTINSILGESKVMTDAFRPATDQVQEIVGIVNGIRISFIDTPGLSPSSTNSDSKNRKILHSVKRFIRKSRPDIILYFERLDLIDMGYCDFPLLKLITDILGPAIWFSTNIVMTHSSAALPEGQNGYPVSYDSYVNYCTQVVQHHIHQAILDTKLENPVILVENHPYCKVDNSGKKVLPNGQVWMSQFMLLCICTKILGDVNTLLEFEDSIQLGPLSNSRLPSLPHLLSSFLKHRVKLSLDGADNEIDELSFSNTEEEDEYDQLPPIRILTRAQFQKLTPSQKKDYLDELDYRETLYLKKQLKQEYIRREEKDNDGVPSGDNRDNQEGPPEAIMLPDMAVPPSFDSDSPVHRFRCLVMSDQWLARPVLDPHGWDHDVGFDGINLEIASEVKKNVITCVAGQMSKDKQDFNVQCESTAAFLDPRGPIYSVGLDVQSAGKETVAGREVPHTTLLGGLANGTAAGGATLARLAIYKVCWAIPGQSTVFESTCPGEDILAAFDDAIADGVHAISISIVPYQLSPYGQDGIALGALHAAKRDIVVVASCGNSGPAPSTVRNVAPWIISVGASSIDRVFSSPVLLGNGMIIEGQTVTPHTLSMMHPLVYAGDVEIPGTTTNKTSGLCLSGTLSRELVQGKIVLCLSGYSRNIEKGLEVRKAGGLGFILQNPVEGISIAVDAHVLPGTAIFANDSARVLNYIKSNKNATARIVPVRTVLASEPSPFMAGFSSTGPNALEPNILKPDITAPGLNILAAWSEATSPTKLFNDNRVVKYNILSGTSMSCPHVAAAAALIKAAHPDWSSAAIRSALMTTSTQTNNMGLPITDGSGNTAATPFHYGSGHFQPSKAVNPGLIYDANYTDYLLYLCNYNSSVQTLDPSFTCPDDFPSPSDLNYPSVTVSNINGSGVSVKRTVTNVGGGVTVYKVSVEAPVGYTVEISPDTINFSSVGQRESFSILIKPKNGLQNGYAFGWYTWSDGIHIVRSPIVVSP